MSATLSRWGATAAYLVSWCGCSLSLQDKMYYAVRGHGAFVRAAGAAQQRRLWSAEFGLQQEGLTVVGASKQPAPETRRFLERLRNPVYKKLGSSLKLLQVGLGWGLEGLFWSRRGDAEAFCTLWARHFETDCHSGLAPRCLHTLVVTAVPALSAPQVAEGSAHVYLRMVPSSEWDTAAAQVIVEEAGGAVLQVGGATGEDGRPWDWQVRGGGSALHALVQAQSTHNADEICSRCGPWAQGAATTLAAANGSRLQSRASQKLPGRPPPPGLPMLLQGDLVPTLQPLEYNKPSLRNPYFVAVGKRRG